MVQPTFNSFTITLAPINVSPELALSNAALGGYQVLGHHTLPHYDYDADRLWNHFTSNPRDYSEKAFVIWVKKHPKFKRQVNSGESQWYNAVSSYYGKSDYTRTYSDNVKRHAREYRSAIIATEPREGGSSAYKAKGRHRNFDLIPDGRGTNYRSGQENANSLRQIIQQYGIKRIIALNRSSDNSVKDGGSILTLRQEKKIADAE